MRWSVLRCFGASLSVSALCIFHIGNYIITARVPSAECPAAGPQQRTKDRDEPISISIPLPSSCAKITQNVSKLEQLSWAALRGAPSGGGWRATVDCSCLGLPWSSVLRGYRTYRLLSFYLEPTGTTIRTLQEELLKGFP